MNDNDCFHKIEIALQNYSACFVNWELLHNDKSYHPDFPEFLSEAFKALKKLKED